MESVPVFMCVHVHKKKNNNNNLIVLVSATPNKAGAVRYPFLSCTYFFSVRVYSTNSLCTFSNYSLKLSTIWLLE